jgi:hypothetical protein
LDAGLPDWLVFGADLRTRFEHRSGRLRNRTEPTRLNFGATRTRLFFGVVPETSPLSFAVELLDARHFATDFPATSATANDLDLLQLRASLDLTSARSLPLEVEIGRFSFDAMDRRLIARNRFRNTLNAFDGVRIHMGRKRGEVGNALELMALWPTERRIEDFDRPDEDRQLVGAIAKLSRPTLVVEPYYLYYTSKARSPATLHTTGVHLFGPIGTKLDHDLHVSLQLGSVDGKTHRAIGLHGELGRSFEGAWAARVAAWLDYASGDSDPNDDRSERFDPLFGAPHPKYGFTDLFNWQNMLNPALGLSFRPHPTVRLSIVHRFHWLASSRDAWVRADLIDPTGSSGSFIGQELDVELWWNFASFMGLNVQYGELFTGSFVERTGGGTGTRGLYIAVTLATP